MIDGIRARPASKRGATLMADRSLSNDSVQGLRDRGSIAREVRYAENGPEDLRLEMDSMQRSVIGDGECVRGRIGRRTSNHGQDGIRRELEWTWKRKIRGPTHSATVR